MPGHFDDNRQHRTDIKCELYDAPEDEGLAFLRQNALAIIALVLAILALLNR